ncbi:amidohydrolase family protein [Pararoseomonas sp. SCSIO 73927]|uniref:amidohydrolase family protein n=1 Tax=Pararoseomonas sp. SCSIO 73927 TaxID=3114537 RepID=UPI0030CA8CE3
MSHDLLLRNVRPMGGPTTDVLIRAGRIAGLGSGLEAPGIAVEDGGGALMIPGLVEAHTHLDKSFWGMGWRPHRAGPTVLDKIEAERQLRATGQIDPARQSARLLMQALRMGTTHIRTHVDVDDVGRLAGLEGVLATRADHADVMDVEIVAFPQSGILTRPGVAALMEDALRMGAEVVGGLDPCAIDRDPKGHLDVVFGLAERFGRPVDIHLHEGGSMGAFSMELILERTRALGLQGQVTVSHAFCLGDPDAALVNPLLEAMAALDVAVATTAPASRPVPAVARLRALGIRVCAGSDGVRDSWNPYGTADMLERAMLVGLRNNFRRDDELELALQVCTHGGASVLRLGDYGLEPGCNADIVLLGAETPAEAVAAHPPRCLVVKRGLVVARNGEALSKTP